GEAGAGNTVPGVDVGAFEALGALRLELRQLGERRAIPVGRARRIADGRHGQRRRGNGGEKGSTTHPGPLCDGRRQTINAAEGGPSPDWRGRPRTIASCDLEEI